MHFVEDQQDPQLTTQAFDALEVMFCRREDTAAALYRLQHDGDGLRIDRCMQGRQIVKRHLAETWQLRFESVFAGHSRRRHRPQAPPMTAIVYGDDVVSATAMQLAPLACQLDGRFTGFGTAVEQIGLVAAGVVAQTVDEVQLRTVVQAQAGVDHGVHLFGNGVAHGLGTVAQAVGTTALTEIQIGAVVSVRKPGALPLHKHLGRARHSGHQALAGNLCTRGMHKQVIQTRREATEQVHTSPPLAT